MPFTDPFVANPYPYSYGQTLPVANQVYDLTNSLVSGVYTISWSGGGTVTVDFYNGSTNVGTATGTSSILFNLAQGITSYKIWSTVAGVTVVISLSALLVASITGTIYTYTASTTPGLIGNAYIVLIGGGGGGASSGNGGGGSGGIQTGKVTLTGVEVLTIGNGGAAGNLVNGSPGGSTIFAGLTATGGGGGTYNVSAGGAGGTPGSPNGASGGAGAVTTAGGGGSTSTLLVLQPTWTFLPIQGSTGGGGGGCNGPTAALGGGTTLGKGGNGASNAAVSTVATGYGAGGGGGGSVNIAATAGTSGLCYIII